MLPVHGSSLAIRAAGRPQGPDPDVRHRDISAGATGWSTYVFYQRKQVRCSDANMVVAKTGMITAAIDVAVRGQAIEAVCHCSGWRRRGQDVPRSCWVALMVLVASAPLGWLPCGDESG